MNTCYWLWTNARPAPFFLPVSAAGCTSDRFWVICSELTTVDCSAASSGHIWLSKCLSWVDWNLDGFLLVPLVIAAGKGAHVDVLSSPLIFLFPFHFWNQTYLGCPPSTLNNNLIFWLCSCQPTSWNICNNVLPHTKHGVLKIQNYPKIEWGVLVHACVSLSTHHMRGSHCCFCCFRPPAYV